MRKIKNPRENMQFSYKIKTLLTGLILILMVPESIAQDKKTVRVNLNYQRENDELPVILTRVRTRPERRWEPVVDLQSDIFFIIGDEEYPIGHTVSDMNGRGQIQLPDKIRQAFDTLNELQFTARLKGHPEYQDFHETLTLLKGRIDVTLAEDSTGRRVNARLLAVDSAGTKPVEYAEIKFYIQRSIADLPMDEDVHITDENGEASVDFPNSIPSVKNGEVEIIVKVEENDELGTIISTTKVDWGVKVPENDIYDKRTLWSTRDKAPIWLLIFPNLILLGIWGVIAYLIVQIFKIRQSGKTENIQ